MNLLWIVSFFWLISEVSLAYIKRASSRSTDLDKSSLKLLWIIIVVSISLGIYLGLSGKGALHSYRYQAYKTGIILICSGLLLRWIAIFQLKKYFTVNVTIGKDHQLIQGGLYRYIRHPSYTGSLLSFFGLGIALNNWLSLLVIFLPILFSFLYRISVEEEALSKSFGRQYEDYRKKSKRLIPWVY